MAVLLIALSLLALPAYGQVASWRGFVKVSNDTAGNATAAAGTVVEAYVNGAFAARTTVKNVSDWEDGYYLINVPGNPGDFVEFRVWNLSINGMNTSPQSWRQGVHPPPSSDDWFNLTYSTKSDGFSCTWNRACINHCCSGPVECNGQCTGTCSSQCTGSPGGGGGGGGSVRKDNNVFFTNDNLLCENASIIDDDNDTVAISGYDWFNGTWLGINSKNLSYSHTGKNQEWKCRMLLNDSFEIAEANSSSVRIMNSPPVLSFIDDIAANESGKITILPAAGDIDNDSLEFLYAAPFNSSGSWQTNLESDGVYTVNVSVSDGESTDSQLVLIAVLNIPLQGNSSNISTNVHNFSMSIGNLTDFTLIRNETLPVKLMKGNLSLVSFDFNFSIGTLDFSRIRVEVQPNSSNRGYALLSGVNLSRQSFKKSILVENITAATGICIKDAEISSIEEISSACTGSNEFFVPCPGTSGQYSCQFSQGMWNVSGLNHSAVIQQEAYCGDGIANGAETCSSCPADVGACLSTSLGGGGGSGGGGGGTAAVSDSAFIQSISAGSSGTFGFSRYAELSISEIKVSMAEQVSNPRISIQEAKLAEGMPFPSGSIYRLVSISKFNFADSQVSSAVIQFKISNSWLNGMDNVRLHRLRGTSWNEMSTSRTASDAEFTTFEAEVPGFSIFAITAEKAVPQIPEEKKEMEIEEIPAEKNITEEMPKEAREQLLLQPNELTGAVTAGRGEKTSLKGIFIAAIGVAALAIIWMRKKATK